MTTFYPTKHPLPFPSRLRALSITTLTIFSSRDNQQLQPKQSLPNTATIPPRNHIARIETMAASSPCALTSVASEAEFNNHISQLPASCLAVIYFNASWAEPCKQMSTILSTLAQTYESTSPPQIAFYSLDAEELADVSEKYDVTQVPLVVLQKGGQVQEQITGTDATKVRSAVEKYAGGNAVTGSLPPAQTVTKQAQPQAQVPHTNGDGMAKYAPNASDPATAPQYSSEQMNGSQSKEDLNARLSELVKAAPVMLFMKGTPSAPQCGFSRQTVSILREKGIRYGFFNILADDEVRQGLKEFSEWPTFPQVYIGGELVGGLDIVSCMPKKSTEFSISNMILVEGGVRERPRLPGRILGEEQASAGSLEPSWNYDIRFKYPLCLILGLRRDVLLVQDQDLQCMYRLIETSSELLHAICCIFQRKRTVMMQFHID